MSTLTKRAIVEANEVQARAEERAKEMLIREFSPKIKSLLSAVINEDVSTGNDQPSGYSPEEDQNAVGTTIDKAENKNINKQTGDGPQVGYPAAKDVNEDDSLPIDADADEDPVVEGFEDEDPVADTDEPVLEGNPEDELPPVDAEDEVVEIVNSPEDTEKDPLADPVAEETEADFDDAGQKTDVMESLKKRNRILSRKNQELLEAVNQLRGKFAKLNTFNAKLAYAFKLMTQPGVTRVEKKQIAEAFDNAHSTREAQLIFNTLKSKHQSRAVVNPFKNRNDKPVASEKTKLNENYERMGELAGL